jgi:hypothetical protein
MTSRPWMVAALSMLMTTPVLARGRGATALATQDYVDIQQLVARVSQPARVGAVRPARARRASEVTRISATSR